MAFIFQKLKQNKVSVLAVLLVAAMLVGLLPLGSVTVHAQEIDLADVTDNTSEIAEGTTLKIFGDTELGIEKLYTYKSGAWTPDDGKKYIAKVDDIAALEGKTLQAVSPATASATEFTIPADQSTAENLLSADWCVSGSVPISDRMSFQLSHLLSKVTVVVDKVGDGYEMPTFDGTNNYIRFTSFTDVTYGDTLSKTDENKTEIKPLLSTTVEDKQAFTAIVYPVSYDEWLLSMYLNNDTTGYAFLSSLSTVDMEPGKHYTFNLTIKTNEIELTLESVNPFEGGWSDEVNLDGSEETIGKEDTGKTDWANGDAVTLSVTGGGIAGQTETITYTDGSWSDLTESFKYLTANDTITATATYAPDAAGLSEHLQATAEVESGKVTTINFPQTRNYSRLRIASQANKNYSVTVTGFTPAGATESGDHTYTLTADKNGNAFLYGTFDKGATVTVKDGDTVLATHTFDVATKAEKSYALDARIGYEVESSNGVVTYKVYTAKGLLAWNEAARNGGSTNLVLMKDIDMSDAGEWTPVGNLYNPYAGTIDGNNYTISNITLSDLTDDDLYGVYVGFVGCMENWDGVSEMKDITFDSPKISMTESYPEDYSVYVGIVGYMGFESTMTNVSVTGETAWFVNNGDYQGYCYIGGIAGVNIGGSISGCTSGATINDLSDTNSERYVGGIAGACSSSGKINGCVFYGNLLASSNSVYSRIGGIVGYIQSSQDEIVGCYVTGTVTAGEGNEASVGTIVGYLYSTDASAVKSCYWSGNDGLNALGHYQGNGDCTKVEGTDVTWDEAKDAMNSAIKTWNESNDNLCDYHYEINTGDDAATRPLILKEGRP